MKVRVDYTVDISDEYRQALACYRGDHKAMATREEVRNHFRFVGSSNDDGIMAEWQECEECEDYLAGRPHDRT